MEEIILLVLIILTMLSIFCIYKIFEKRGLYFILVIMNIISFVITFKITTAFELNINIGIVTIISILTILYLYIIKYGEKDKKNLLKISLYSNVTTALLLVIMNYLVPAITETISINMQGTFEYNYKILIVYPLIIFISELLSMKLFSFIKSIQNNAIIDIILTYIIVGLLYTVIFYVIIYINILNIQQSLFLGISTYIIGLPIAIVNAIFVNYIANKKVIK